MFKNMISGLVALVLLTDSSQAVTLRSDPICDSANRETCVGMPRKSPYPMNYFVPNFGLDSDILDTQRHMADLEKAYGL